MVEESYAELAKMDAKFDRIIQDLNQNVSEKNPPKAFTDDLSSVKNVQTSPGHGRLNTWANFDNIGNHLNPDHNRHTTFDKTDFNIKAISNPLEDEAENAIIRALESKQWESQSGEDLLLKTMYAVSRRDLDTSSNELTAASLYVPEEQKPTATTIDPVGATKLQDLATQLQKFEGKEISKGLEQNNYLSRAVSHKQLRKDVAVVQQNNDSEDTFTKNLSDTSNYNNIIDEEAQFLPQPVQKDGTAFESVGMNDGGSAFTRNMEKNVRTTSINGASRQSGVSINDPLGRNSVIPKRLLRDSKEMVEELHWSLKYKLFLKILIYVIVPGLLISAILFYAAGNPLVGAPYIVTVEVTRDDVSYSWWILFGVRQVILLCLAIITEIVIVEILMLRISRFQRYLGSFGSFVALSLIQSRGWPYIITIWGVLDFCLLHGNRKFARQWLYNTDIRWFKACTFVRQNYGIVNGQFIPPDIYLEGDVQDCNPAGNFVSSALYEHILFAAIVLGATVTVKRVAFGIYIGKKATETYIPKLEKLMAKMVIIGEVAHLAKEIWEDARLNRVSKYNNRSIPALKSVDDDDDSGSEQDDSDSDDSDEDEDIADDEDGADEDDAEDEGNTDVVKSNRSLDLTEPQKMAQVNASINKGPGVMGHQAEIREEKIRQPINHRTKLHATAKQKLSGLVGEWEEPITNEKSLQLQFSVRDVLEFRRAVHGLNKQCPFSYAFGRADTREACLESARKVYGRLLLHTPGESKLPFETISLIAMNKTGSFDEKRVKKLIRMFRPNHHGYIGPLVFMRSCDRVYKQLRTLRASIINSSQIDHAFEKILNAAFYFVMILVLLGIFRYDPWPIFASASTFLLGFSFMFSTAASKYFDGILLVLFQKPFDIGDRVHLSAPMQDTSPDGSSTWIVEAVTLHSTTMRFATTNEVATFSNGILADLRIINANRSPKAIVYIYNKFASDVPYEKVMVFKSAIENFVAERPGQWIAMNGFRSTRLEADRGFIEYVIVLTHVEKWQNVVAVLSSKAELSSYCLEVQRQLGMKYEAPPLPVNLGLVGSRGKISSFERDQLSKEIGDSPPPDFDKLASWFTANETKKFQ